MGIIFFILVWFVLFKNIDEAISSVENDIISFEDKLGNDEKLSSIKTELEKQQNKILPKQKRKLLLAKILTILILALILIAYVCIHYGYLKSIVNNDNKESTLNQRANTQAYTFAIRTSQFSNPNIAKEYAFSIA